MKTMLKFRTQIVALEELAKLLQVDRNEVHVLLTREHHPLPLPPNPDPFDPWILNGVYLTQLDNWLREEAMRRTTQEPQRLDVRHVQTEIARAKNGLAEYDFKDRFPPGHFLG